MKDDFPIAQLRKETPACQHKIHLNNAGASLSPTPVLAAIRAYFDLEARTGGYEAAALKADEIVHFYDVLAQFLHTKAHNIAFTTNATDAYAKALSSIPFQRDDVILTTDHDYVSNQIAFLYLQQRVGIKIIHAAKRPDGAVAVDSMESLIQKYRPKLVAVTHVPTNAGVVQDVYTIGKICAEQNTLYLVDACQSVGQLEVNVAEMQCDFLSATFRKFLRGPRGTGFLYVSDKVLERALTPIFPDLQGAEWIARDKYVLQKSAKRFEYWERNFANVLGAKTAVEYALQIGMPVIEKRVKSLASYTQNTLSQLKDFQVLDRSDDLCGIITLHSPKFTWQHLKQHLINQHFNVSVAVKSGAWIDFEEKGVDWALRISPHYYNTAQEIDLLFDFLSNLS
ncbi:MAG: aminotransferase class V-fold PLP-dependent enzyme [Bacteroidota bacterium]